MYVKAGTTSQSLVFYLQDAGTGGAYTTEDQADWTFNYVREGVAAAVADATIMAGTLGTWADGKSKPFGTTGLWQIDFADAAFAAGVDYVTLLVTHDNGDFIPATMTIELAGRESDVVKIHGTALTETAGQLAAGFKKVFNVATPVFTAASVNQTGDSYGIVNHGAHGNAKLLRTGADSDTGETLSDQLDGLASAQTGGGAITDTFTVTQSGTPVAGFDVWVSTDEAGSNVIAGTLVTNVQGLVTFNLDIADGLWAHAQKAGYNATGYPKEFNVAAGGFEWA